MSSIHLARSDNLKVTINIYKEPLIRHLVSDNERKQTIQDLCHSLLISYFPDETIGPAAFQLFGLVYYDDTKKMCIWMNPKKCLKDISLVNEKGEIDLYLRIRFLPIKDRISGNLLMTDLSRRLKGEGYINYLVWYLYNQVKDDFVTDRLYTYFNTKVDSSKARGIAVLDLLIMARCDNLECPEKIIDTLKPETSAQSFVKNLCAGPNCCLAKVLPKRERSNWWKDMKLKKNMKSKLLEYSNQYPPDKVSTEDLIVHYVCEIMANFTEKHLAKDMKDGNLGKEVEVTVNIPNGCGVFIRENTENSIEQKLCTVSELQSVSIEEKSAGGNKSIWFVLINRSNGFPVTLYFESLDTAESFVSGLDGYFRLIHNYYFSLCDQVEPPSLKAMLSIKSHGPIEDEFARKKLKTYAQQEFYILKQDVYVHDRYAIVYSHDQGQIRSKFISKNAAEGFYIEGVDGNFYPGLKELLGQLTIQQDILPKNALRIKPKLECCEVLQNLFLSQSNQMNTEEEDSASYLRKRQPLIYLASDVTKEGKLGNGYFTEVFRGKVRGIDKLVAIKQIRDHKSHQKSQQFYCYDSLQKSTSQQLAYDDVRFFVPIHGICLTSPHLVIEEYAQYGSLSNFFTLGKPFTPQHFLFLAIQLAEALFFMDEKKMHHGNICCRNILVFRYDAGDISVKLGDSGMVHIYNQLPLSHCLNSQRIPWIAPELFPDLTKTSIASDVYAFSTTLWECSTLGRSPLQVKPLLDFKDDFNKIKDFYEKEGQIDFPKELVVTPKERTAHDYVGQNKAWKLKETVTNIMTNCWSCQEKRMEPSQILRDLRDLHTGYMYNELGGKQYYYSEIQDFGQESLCAGETSHLSSTGMAEIPDVMCHITGTVGHSHVAAENLRVNVPSHPPTESSHRNMSFEIRQQSQNLNNKDLLEIGFLIGGERIKLESKVLGSGHYGEVRLGKLYDSATKTKGQGQQIVAKVLKECQFQNVLESEEFKKEAKIMSKLKHQNIVEFIGISDNKLIMEYIELGCIRDYMKDRKKKNNLLPVLDILKILSDVATGMAYLASERILHCDLAARNVLLTKDLRAKISDFGLSKILGEKDYYKGSGHKSLPAWWCSPEALQYRRFTSSADIWSFGVVMWEAFTHCESPKLCSDVTKLVVHLNDGRRLKKPPQCPDKAYELMRDCWKFEYKERPDFPTVEKRCRELEYMHKQEKTKENENSGNQNTERGSQNSDASSGQSERSSQRSSESRSQSESGIIMSPSGSRSSQSSDLEKEKDKKSNKQNQKTGKESKDNVKEKDEKENQNNTKEVIYSRTNKKEIADGQSTNQNENSFSAANGSNLPIARPLSDQELKKMSMANGNQNDQARVPMPGSVSQHYLIERRNIKYTNDDLIGAGNFGCVYKATFTKEDGSELRVAIKTFSTTEEPRNVEEEANILEKLEHQNIVKFYGFCRTAQIIVMELVKGDNLVKYLQKCKHEKQLPGYQKLLQFCLDIAQGMEYLASKSVIHCDLACRNVLLTEDLKPKITDFGLSKFLADKGYYTRSMQKKTNILWSAPETVNSSTRKLSTESDVWSFGIVMWEIFSYGAYPNICGTGMNDMDHFASFIIQQGCNLAQTDNCPEHVYSLMKDCWKMEPKNRPSFTGLVGKLKSFFHVPAIT